MEKIRFLDIIPEHHKKLYSLNFLMARLKEFEPDPETSGKKTASPVSSQYNTRLFLTYDLYKPISTMLDASAWELLKKEKDI